MDIFDNIWAYFDLKGRSQEGRKLFLNGKDSTNQYQSKMVSISNFMWFLSPLLTFDIFTISGHVLPRSM